MLIISNGFSRFHLAVAAAEAHRHGILTSFITGAYPTPLLSKVLSSAGLTRSRKLARLAARREEIPSDRVRSLLGPEVVYCAAMAGRRVTPEASLRLNAFSFRYYGNAAVKYIREAAANGARLYHYRSGFGHESVREARRLGLATLCDHSIVHPALLEGLAAGDGQMPPPGEQPRMDRLWSEILDDIQYADAVLVNSDFVRRTFIYQGYDPNRLHVVHLGVDDAFLNTVPTRAQDGDCSGPIRLLFAGGFNRRKGAETLIAALRLLDDVAWSLDIVGSVDADIRPCSRPLIKDARVSITGWSPRNELAKRMAAAEVFVFPSLAEGSARVVFEALAAGCYVITTPNAGSIVEDRVHGRLVPPGEPQRLAAAIRDTAHTRSEIAEIGRRNARLIRSRYRQRDYGDKLAALYHKLLGSPVTGRAA